MKKVLIVGGVLLGIALFFFLGLAARPMFGMSADALSGETTVSPRRERKSMQDFGGGGYQEGEAAPIMAPPPSPEAKEERAAKKDGRMRSLGMMGSGKGGGGMAVGIGGLAVSAGAPGRPKGAMARKPQAEPEESESRGEEANTRAWFPETFLFEPLVQTDAQGRANLPVKVPDRLTTWQVLALAHTRQGAQAGAVTSFLGTLPTYVEPVAPPFLYAGDAVRLPVQVVNTTDGALASSLELQAMGATLSSVGGTVKVPAGGSVVEYVTLTTTRPGTAQLKATLRETDAVVRTIEVKPPGRRELVSHGGSLAAPRTFDLDGPANAIAGSESVALQVYPGALGFLRTELAAAPGRGGVAEDGYLLQLLGKAPALLRALGAEPATDTIRELSLLATQRVMRYARAPSVDTASLLAEAALAHPDNPVLSRLGERLTVQLAREQRPDGTCQGANGWTLQRLMVTTADCVRAVRASTTTPQEQQRATGVSIKATGAFERNLARITEGYTAAAILASGAVEGTLKEKLRALVLANLEKVPDGGAFLKVESGVVRADGLAPSTIEATALAVLALAGEEKAPLADLGTFLLGGYSPYSGWGDGRTNLVALRAVTTLFKDPLPSSVHLVLERDGQQLAEGTLGADKLKEVVTLDATAAGSSGRHHWTVRAEPPVAGLGYALSLVAWVPWKDEPGGGLELTTKLPATMKVGDAAELELTAAVPSGMPTALRLSLPAGVQPEGPSLEALVSGGQVLRFETEDGAIVLHLPALSSGSVFQAKLKVVPTLAGTLQSGASEFGPEGSARQRRFFAPKTWTIR